MNRILYIFPLAMIFMMWSCATGYKSAENKMKEGKYETAIEMYKSLMADSKDQKLIAMANYHIGECYRLSNRMPMAEPFYKKAFKSQVIEDENLLYHYAFALKAVGNYESAEKGFKKYVQEGSNYNQTKRARQELKNLTEVGKLSEPDPYITIENCDALNSSAAEYSPIVVDDRLIFTSSRESSMIYEATGTGFTNLFYYDLDKDKNCEGTPTPFNDLVNLEGFHEASPTFTKNGKVMVFARSNAGKKKDIIRDVKLYYSQFDGENWSEAKVLFPVSNYDNYNGQAIWDACPALTADGERLYFASNRPGGYGGIDIYRSDLQANGQWSRPKNMGKTINTAGNDMFPFITREGVLYFASDGHAGIGGLDIFRATMKDGKIKIKNLGAPINSTADDFGLTLKDRKNGYFASNRASDGAKGDDDIYYFEDNTPDTKTVNYFLAGTSYLEEDINRTLLANVKMELLNEKGEVIGETTSDSVGRFKFETPLEIGYDYTVVGNKTDFISKSRIFSTIGKGIPEDDLEDPVTNIVFETDVVLFQNVFIALEGGGGDDDGSAGASIVLEGILYDLDSWEIRPDAARELDKLVAFLKSKPYLMVELGAHTDSRASNRYNMKLSRRRAEAAVEYIVEQGISEQRIVAKGYGETQLVIPDAVSEEEHQVNRRTTVTVLGQIDPSELDESGE